MNARCFAIDLGAESGRAVGGDLQSIAAGGFARLSLDKLEALIRRYRGEAHEDDMVALYPAAHAIPVDGGLSEAFLR